MIREIINFVKDLERDYPEIFELNKTPSPGLHFWVELDEEGNWKNNRPEEGVDYVVFDGKEALFPKHIDAIKYEDQGRRLGNNMNKVLDKKKQIFSCSPFIVSYKLKSYDNEKLEGNKEEKLINLFDFYFDNAQAICLDKEDTIGLEKSNAFKAVLPDVISFVSSLILKRKNKDDEIEELKLLDVLKEDHYLNFYLNGLKKDAYSNAHEKYLQEKLFNVNDYNSDKEITPETWGISDFINGTGAKFSKKAFLQHKTGSLYKGVASRIQAKDAVALNKFEALLSNRVLPNPLPIFIDKNEFKEDKNNSEVISVFNKEGERKFTYPQLLKKLYEKNEQRVLGNYYLLNISRGVVNDFDFVSNFQYKLDMIIENLYALKQKKELAPAVRLHTIFGFENIVVTKIFNNALVKEKKGEFSYNYFNDIDPNYVSGGDEIANLIMRFRKAFYDYIYKSRKQAITSTIFDEIMLKTIMSDLKHDEFKDGYHTKETSIKEKLNIWFSLYNNFSNNSINRENMAKTFKELLEKMDLVANDPEVILDIEDVGEFLFAAGQIIYFLLTKSKASNPTFAMLEPFLQKTNATQLQTAIGTAINTYKHELGVYKDRFQRLASQVLVFPTNENLKNYQRYLLAGCFAPSCIYKSSKEKETSEVSNN